MNVSKPIDPATDTNATTDTNALHRRIAELKTQKCALQRQLNNTLLLNRVITAAASALDPTAVLTHMCSELAQHFGLPQAALAQFDPDGANATVIAEYTTSGSISALGAKIPVDNNPITAYILEHHAPLAVEDVVTDPRLAIIRELMSSRKTASLLVVPVIMRGKVIGTLGLDSFERRAWPDEDIVLAQQVATAISQSLENASLYAAMQQELTERKRAEEIIRRQAATLAELSSPLIPLADHVLILPLVGAIDTERAQHILETLLNGITEHQASTVIIDITGVAVVDTHVANMLLQSAQAVKLLGAQVILSGIRPEVAQTMIGLGIDLRSVITCRTVQSGVALAMARQ